MDYSPEAAKARENSAARQDACASWHARGPFYHESEPDVLIVPSIHYSEEAKKFWQSRGFHFVGGILPSWKRDVTRPLDGRVFGREEWLQAARKKYAEFYGWRAPASEQKFVCSCGQRLRYVLGYHNGHPEPAFWYGCEVVTRCPRCNWPLHSIFHQRPHGSEGEPVSGEMAAREYVPVPRYDD